MSEAPIDYKKLLSEAPMWAFKTATPAAASTTTEKDEEVPKSYGRALYLEFREGSTTYQMVFTSETVSPKTHAFVPMTGMYRQVSAAHDKRGWRYRTARDKVGTLKEGSIDTLQEQTTSDTLKAVGKVLAEFQPHIQAMNAGEWSLYKEPVVVEMSAEDVVKIEEQQTPGALIRRITRARQDLGFEDSIYGKDA